MNHYDAVAGAILGCAVGDALGLPYEGISKRRASKLFGKPDRHRFIFGRGMVSDDTEHTTMLAQSLCRYPNDSDLFAKDFARRLRWWLLGVPAGIGLATLKAILKLWLGFSPKRSGVFSAGNGPAMRSAILGAAFDQLETVQEFVQKSTMITHTDPKAYRGAFAVALAAWCAKRGLDSPSEYFPKLRSVTDSETDADWKLLVDQLEGSLAKGQSTEEFAQEIGCRQEVSGYVYRTVPVVLHAWLTSPRDFRIAVMAVIECGGDTDTTAAIVGAIIGTAVGPSGIPKEWINQIWEWPRSVDWMNRLARETANATAKGESTTPPKVVPGLGLVRNAVFIGIVFKHILRRMLPPY